MYGCESWTIKKTECQIIDAFELWCWSRLLDCKEIQPVHPKGNQSCVFFGRNDAKAETPAKAETLATSCEELTHWKRPWCWEGLGAGGEGDDRGWDGWMASPTWWTWVWVKYGSFWWTGRPGMLWFMRSQRVGHDWATELNWTEEVYVLHLHSRIFRTLTTMVQKTSFNQYKRIQVIQSVFRIKCFKLEINNIWKIQISGKYCK